MGRLIRALIFFLAGSAMGLGAVGHGMGLEWPVTHKVLTATFGENRSDHFHDGIDIGGGEQAVHPAAAGEVLFTHEEGGDPRDLPTGLGSFIVVQNGQGIRTLYAHLRRGSVPQEAKAVTPQDVIGIIGDTGDSQGRHLHFEVIDETNGETVNPLVLLPPLPDTQRPVIASVSIEKNRKRISLSSPTVVASGKVSLVVNVYDPSQYVDYFDPMAPYQIKATLNGQEIFNVRYDALQERDGSVYLVHSDHRDFSNYYVGTWSVRLGSFALKPGTTRLVVTARDIVGNTAVRSYELHVQGTSGR